MRYVELLSVDQVEQVHEASLEILESVGVLVRNEKARARFGRHGCRVDADSQLVRIPRAVVEEQRAIFPPRFTLHARDPQNDCTLPDDAPLLATGSSAPDVVDPVTGRLRRARSDDIARIAHLVNELPGYDVFTVSVTADDAPPGQRHLSRYYPALKNCLKPVQCSAPGPAEAEAILRLGTLIAGGEGAYRERPFMTYLACPMISPLTFDVDSTEAFMHFAEEGLPHYVVGAPNAGMTAPLTMLGTLAVCNAEFLAQGVLAQISRPRTPLIYGQIATVADMRTGAYAPGGIETGMLLMGCAQMARSYNVPCAGFAGVTNAKVNDAQSGYETGMPALAAALAGVHLVVMGCVIDALMAFDFGAAVIGSEIGQMVKRAARGFEADAKEIALEAIAEAGPGGTFIDSAHTLKRIRTTALLPTLADRLPRDQWQARGALDTHARAMQRVHEILAGDNPAVFSPEVDARVRAGFAGLVAGDATALEPRNH